MKNGRYWLGWHAWFKPQVEDSQYLECARCGTDRAAIGPAPGSPGSL